MNITDRASPSYRRLDDPKYLLPLYLWLAVVTGAVSFTNQHRERASSASLQREIWEHFQARGSAGGGAGYSLYRANCTRILIPSALAGIVRVTGLSWDRAFTVLRLLSIFAAYVAFHYYSRGWFSSEVSLASVLFVASTISLTLIQWFEIPTDFAEILTYTLGLWCIRDGRDALLCLVIALGTLSRETTVFLPLILALCRFGREPLRYVASVIAAAGLSWFVPLALLRWWTGIGVRYNHGDSVAHNLEGLRAFLANLNPYNLLSAHLGRIISELPLS